MNNTTHVKNMLNMAKELEIVFWVAALMLLIVVVL